MPVRPPAQLSAQVVSILYKNAVAAHVAIAKLLIYKVWHSNCCRNTRKIAWSVYDPKRSGRAVLSLEEKTMHNPPKLHTAGSAGLKGLFRAVMALGLALSLSGCFFVIAKQDIDRDGSHPWWCQGGSVTLTDAECLQMSAYFDNAVRFAEQYWTEADFVTNGGGGLDITATGFFQSTNGIPYFRNVQNTFDPMTPNMIWYGVEPGATATRPVAVGWIVSDTGGGPPAGFAGDQDVWTLVGPNYYLIARVMRGYQDHGNIFSTSHPCLSFGNSSLSATTDACYTSTHTEPLEILVTNDDGIDGHGIDALVEGLKTVPGVTFNIVAPATQQSGTGGSTTPGPLTANPGATLSGEGGVAVDGFPADAVIHALRDLKLSPDVTMSGINDGQNLASIGDGGSGTIGAARRSTMRGIPALALSQGSITVTPDFPAGVAASLALLENWRIGRAGSPFMELPNLNIPSCDGTGTITGTVETVVGVDLSSGPLNGTNYFGVQDCSSSKTVFVDDLDAFLNGWTSIADMGRVQPPNYP